MNDLSMVIRAVELDFIFILFITGISCNIYNSNYHISDTYVYKGAAMRNDVTVQYISMMTPLHRDHDRRDGVAFALVSQLPHSSGCCRPIASCAAFPGCSSTRPANCGLKVIGRQRF